MGDLEKKAIRALSWSFVQEASLRGLQFGISIFLARILVPEEYGLIGMLSVFIGLAQALVDGGFASALIQAKQPTDAHKCSVFYFNLGCSVIFAAIFLLAAPWIAGFYHQPLLAPILRVMVWVPVVNGIGIVQNALLMRQLDFKKQTIILVSSTVGSGLVALAMAWRGYGVWSLVFQQLTQCIVRSALLWMLTSWRPKWLFCWKALREMFAFGWGMVCSGLLGSFFDNYYQMLIGRYFSAADLGYYNRAQSLQINASQALGVVVNRVTFPLFSGLQEDLVRFRKGLRKAMTTIAFIQFPMMIGMAVVARPLVLFLFTEKWAFSIPYLQLLSLIGVLYPMNMLNLNVVLSLGRSDLFFRLQVAQLVVVFINGVVTIHWGVMAMIWGQLICSVGVYFLNGYYTKRLIDYSVWNQIQDLYPCLIASSLMGLAVLLLGRFLPFGNLGQLICQVLFGAVVYFVISRSMRLPALGQLLGIVWRRGATAADNPA